MKVASIGPHVMIPAQEHQDEHPERVKDHPDSVHEPERVEPNRSEGHEENRRHVSRIASLIEEAEKRREKKKKNQQTKVSRMIQSYLKQKYAVSSNDEDTEVGFDVYK